MVCTLPIRNALAVTVSALALWATPAAAATPFATFNNAAGLNSTTISTLSVVGTNGAFSVAAAG